MVIQAPIEVANEIYTLTCYKCNKSLLTGTHKECMAEAHKHHQLLDAASRIKHTMIMVPQVR